MDILKNKKIWVAGALVLVGGIGVYMFGGTLFTSLPTLAPEDLSAENIAATSQSIEKELIDELLDLKNITLDRTPIDSNAYRSLEDFSRPIDPEPVGRPNPFLPINAPVSEEGQ